MKKLLARALPSGLVLALPLVTLAQWQGSFIEWERFLGGLRSFINVAVFVVIALATIFFLWGLMLFVLSAGDEEKRAKGKSIMIWGIIALVLMVAIWGIVNLLSQVFGTGQVQRPPIL